MITPIVRWIFFILIGIPFQFLIYIIYPVFHLFWRVFIYKDSPIKDPKHEYVPDNETFGQIRDSYFHNNDDDHNALTHWGLFWTLPNLGLHGLRKLITSDGAFLRRWVTNTPHDGDSRPDQGFHVSGDCVVSWCFAAAGINLGQNPQLFDLLVSDVERAANHYLKNLGTVSNMPDAKNWVSARCNNFGINFCPDGTLGLGQPMTGPQFYTNSCLFALAYAWTQKPKWKFIFWTHWFLFGGWFWAFSPVLYTKNWKGGYVRDITMKALWVHLHILGPRWWILHPMEFITFKIAEYRNDLFFAMWGMKISGDLPHNLNPFFSQNFEANNEASPRINQWVRPGVEKVQILSSVHEKEFSAFLSKRLPKI